jgi:hypothetical protein
MALTSSRAMASVYFSLIPSKTESAAPTTGRERTRKGSDRRRREEKKRGDEHSLRGWRALTGGLQMVMSATPSSPTSMVTRIAAMAAGGSREGGGREQRRGRERKRARSEAAGGAFYGVGRGSRSLHGTKKNDLTHTSDRGESIGSRRLIHGEWKRRSRAI